MKLSKTHWYRRFLTWTKGLFRENPVLSLGLAVPFAAAAATSLQSSVALAVGATAVLIPVTLLMAAAQEKLPQWLRLPASVLLASLLLIPTRGAVTRISAALLDSVGIYFSLLCVSTLLMAELDWAKEQEKAFGKILLHSLRRWFGFALVVLATGAIREVLGSGTIWGQPVTWMKVRFSGALVAGFGFILLGFLSAAGRKLHRTILLVDRWAEKRGKAAVLAAAESSPEPKKRDDIFQLFENFFRKKQAKQKEEKPASQPAEPSGDQVEDLLKQVAEDQPSEEADAEEAIESNETDEEGGKQE